MQLWKIAPALLYLALGAAWASPQAPRNGAEYVTLAAPQPTQAEAGKVEVVEFFMYHCPACNALEPFLAAWVKQRADRITFRRIHMPHQPANDPEARLFLTLDAMKLEDALHDKVLRTWHVERKRLLSDADNLDWAVKNGLDKAKFLSFYNSFAVQAMLRRLPSQMSAYRVDSTPTLVVDGRFVTNPSMVGDANRGLDNDTAYPATLQVVDALVAAVKAK